MCGIVFKAVDGSSYMKLYDCAIPKLKITKNYIDMDSFSIFICNFATKWTLLNFKE